MGTLYLLYFLRDQVHYKHPAQGLFILIAIYTGFVIVTAIVGGVISDRIGKRKMIVTVSGCLMGAAALLLTFVETWPAAMVAAVLFGAGFGAYLAVDQALITQVLPAAKDRAKDLGIINIAIVGPAALPARSRRCWSASAATRRCSRPRPSSRRSDRCWSGRSRAFRSR